MQHILKSVFSILLLSFIVGCQTTERKHPTIYVKDNDRSEILSKIETQPWAKSSFDNIVNEVTPFVERHVQDPEWITSRLCMYWKDGERYTQCYINSKQDWDYGEGNAPVPTVRLPGMRRWNDYVNVPLEDRIPYSESGDMLGISRSNGDPSYVTIPYKETGHMIRANNAEILDLAQKASFIYWINKDERYAKFAADVLWTWLLGTYYMEPALDPGKATGGLGGYEPGGIMGYYDYEQIHDDRQTPAAIIYDFLYYYLQDNPHSHLETIDKTPQEVAGVVFKRFIDLGLIRGGKQGNWNVNGYKNIINSMLVLESNDFYADKKGREYYIPYYTEITTDYHEALPDIMKIYDEKTGLWPESPGYASGMIPIVFDLGMRLYNNGINTLDDNPMILKAVLANLNWLDARGNLVVFGDMRGGPFGFSVFEDVLAYYTKENNPEGAAMMASIIKNGIELGQYSRSKVDWKGICLYEPIPEQTSELPYKRSAYSEKHRHIILKNGNDVENGMMFTLYGGEKGSHLSANGLAMQFYGNGWALGAKSSAYQSYWSSDFGYHSGATGSNTILPGYTKGEIIVNGIDPAIGDNGFYNTHVTSTNCSFADISADEKRRTVTMIRTSENSGYYVDIFRSNQKDNDYLHHNLGNDVQLLSKSKKAISTRAAKDLEKKGMNKNYSFFENPQKAIWNKDFIARWTINNVNPKITTDMWMMGQNNRALYSVDAPPTTIKTDITPGQVNRSPEGTPVLIVRQSNNNAESNPFISVFESYKGENSTLKDVSIIKSSNKSFSGVKVESKNGSVQYICNATDNKVHQVANNITFKGMLAVTSVNNNEFDYLYLGKGISIEKDTYKIESVDGNEVSAELKALDGKYYYSSDKAINITVAGKVNENMPAGYNIELK